MPVVAEQGSTVETGGTATPMQASTIRRRPSKLAMRSFGRICIPA